MMRKLRAFWMRVRGLIGFRHDEDDFAAELESHVAMHTEDGIRAGLSPEEARRRALIRLGGVEQTRQAYRERRGLPWLETLWQDMRFGLRMLAKSPAFTAVAVLTLALGIGVNSAVFTVAEAALLRSWPARAPERLAKLHTTTPQGDEESFSYPDYVDLAAQTKSLEGVVASSRRGKILRVGAESKLILDDVVSPNYFQVLGIAAQRGGTAFASSWNKGAMAVVISDSLWRRAFSADPALVGKQILLTGQSYTVVGIAPRGFQGLQRWIPADLWIPVTSEFKDGLTDRDFRDFELLARLRPGVTATQAKAELETVGRRLALAYPATDKARHVGLVSEQERLREAIKPALFLMAAVCMVLLICCANIAGLVLARADARRKEMAMRLALGCRRMRLVRQLLTENLLLALLGAGLGLLLAAGLFRLQPALVLPSEVTLGLDLHLDASVIVFTVAISVLAVLVFGLAPALQACRTNAALALKGDGQGANRSLRRLALRNVLVSAEIALSVVLLTASGLVVHSLLVSQSIPLGFDRQRDLIFFDLLPGVPGYDARHSLAYFEQVEERVAALPGVRHASLARRVLLSDSGGGVVQRVSIPGVQLPQGQTGVPIKFDAVFGNYFETMGTRLREGRAFTSADTPEAARVVIVSQTMAERYWPGQDALGRQIMAEGKPYQIVGVVEDAKINSVHEAPEPYMYFPCAQMPSEDGTLIVDAAGNADALTSTVRTAIESVDRKVPVEVRPLSYLMRQAFWSDRMTAGFVATLGLLGIFLGAIGLYGVVAFVVNRRSQEIGIRMALGAERAAILRLIVGQGLALAAAGAGVGLIASLAVARLLSSLLYGVRPTDPISFAGSLAVVILVALAASWFPARRAASIDPMRALRTE